jgi:hypothetical protein
VGDVASAVENVLAAYSDTTVAPHEYFDQRDSMLSATKTAVKGMAVIRRTAAKVAFLNVFEILLYVNALQPGSELLPIWEAVRHSAGSLDSEVEPA